MNNMRDLLKWLSRHRFPYEPLITVEISKSKLLGNLDEFRKLAPHNKIAPVLKSNAYGHGLIEIAKILEESQHSSRWTHNKKDSDDTIPFFVVDSYFEALALRSGGIKTPILIIGYTHPETITSSRLHKIAFTVTSLKTLKGITDPKHPVNIHLKIDTGMHRQGILESELPEALSILEEQPDIILEGICSHLSDADNTDESFTDEQIHVWNRLVKLVHSHFPHIKYTHLANTDGHRFVEDIHSNITRLGIGLYGLGGDSIPHINIHPVMEIKTIITGIKKIKSGDVVGYGGTFKAVKDMTIATIPMGYFEGIDRHLSNNGIVLVGERRTPCPIIGRVSMNITTIDISDLKDIDIGTSVIAISGKSSDGNSIREIAKKCNMITYEIAVYMPAHLRRVVVD